MHLDGGEVVAAILAKRLTSMRTTVKIPATLAGGKIRNILTGSYETRSSQIQRSNYEKNYLVLILYARTWYNGNW